MISSQLGTEARPFFFAGRRFGSGSGSELNLGDRLRLNLAVHGLVLDGGGAVHVVVVVRRRLDTAILGRLCRSKARARNGLSSARRSSRDLDRLDGLARLGRCARRTRLVSCTISIASSPSGSSSSAGTADSRRPRGFDALFGLSTSSPISQCASVSSAVT